MGQILVTGASGFIGRRLVHHFLRAGHSVVGLYSSTEPGYAWDDSLRLERIDLRDHGAMANLFGRYRIDQVYHLAAFGVRSGASGWDDAIAVNAVATAALARLALRHQVERFHYVGSGFEYKPQHSPVDECAPLQPINVYGATKVAAYVLLDYLCRVEGLPLVVHRPFSIYGPGEHATRFVPYVIECALRRERMRLTQCTQIRDYLFVEDFVEALALSRSRPVQVGTVLNFGGGPERAQPIRAVVETVLSLVGAPSDLALFGVVERKRPEPESFVADTTRAQAVLGWQCSTELVDGLSRTIEWYRASLDK